MICERLYLNDYYPELGENGCNAYVDCYIPSRPENAGETLKNKKYPCMVICPGGGYSFTSDREAEPIALQFFALGYRVFIIRYSVKPHSFPQPLREIAGLMEILYDRAEEWNADVSKTAIIGFSAGGHLAAQYSNRYDCPEVRALFPESKPVQASILCYAVLSAKPGYTHKGTITNFVGGYEPEDMTHKGCSCELTVTEKTPPTFLWHTAQDQAVPVECSLWYAQELSAHKIPFELHIYPYGQHGLATVDGLGYKEKPEANIFRNHKWIEDAKSWLEMIWA